MPADRRARASLEDSALNLNLTPLLDVVLQLITFFMMLIHFGNQLEGETRAVRLPVAPAALPGSDLALDRLAVALDARGRPSFSRLQQRMHLGQAVAIDAIDETHAGQRRHQPVAHLQAVGGADQHDRRTALRPAGQSLEHQATTLARRDRRGAALSRGRRAHDLTCHRRPGRPTALALSASR